MRREIFILGTNAIIDLDSNDKDIMDNIVGVLNKYDDDLSFFKEDSYVSKINACAGSSFVKVPAYIIDLVNFAIEYGDLSGGLLDIAFRSKSGSYKDIIIDNDSIMLSKDGMAIDFGSIAKGCVTDQVVRFLNENNVSNYILDFGGNVFVKNKDSVKVFINNDTFCYLDLNNKSAVTSGEYERGSHIVNPFGGSSDLYSVTIVDESSLKADAFSTIGFLMGFDKARLFFDNFGISYVIVNNNKKVICSSLLKGEFILLDESYEVLK